MVSNTMGAWVNDGVTDQTTNAAQVSITNNRLTMNVAFPMAPLLATVEIRFRLRILAYAFANKAVKSSGH